VALQTATILLVEDSTMIRSMAARILRKHGYQVVEAPNGEEALATLNTQPDFSPQLLITDFSMPKMDGDQLARQIQRLHPTIKVLFISGHTDRALSQYGLLDTGHAILPKPFTPNLLVETVRELLSAA